MYKFHHNLKYAAVVCLGLSLAACESRRQVEGNEEVASNDGATYSDTAKVVETGKTADDQLEEFRGWLNKQKDKGDSAIRQEWPQEREKLRQRNTELEQKFDSLSVKGKQEFRQLQKGYAAWEADEERRRQQPLEAQEVAQWRNQLLGEYSTIDNISAANIREAYLTFMGGVRAKRRGWSQNDWDYADHVYSQLNQRRRQLEGQITSGDNLKITTLQAEYLALEGGADTKSILKGRK